MSVAVLAPPQQAGFDRPAVALTVPLVEPPEFAAEVWGAKSGQLQRAGLAVSRLSVDYDQPRVYIETWSEELRKVGGLVVACATNEGILPMDEMTMGQVHVATQLERLIFVDVPPKAWDLPESGMSVTGVETDFIMGTLANSQLVNFYRTPAIIRRRLRDDNSNQG